MRRALLSLVVLAGFVAALFVATHAGPLGRDECQRQAFGGPGSLSLDPLGTVCRGGEPTREAVFVSHYFVLGLIIAAVCAVALGAMWLLMRAPSESRQRLPL